MFDHRTQSWVKLRRPQHFGAISEVETHARADSLAGAMRQVCVFPKGFEKGRA